MFNGFFYALILWYGNHIKYQCFLPADREKLVQHYSGALSPRLIDAVLVALIASHTGITLQWLLKPEEALRDSFKNRYLSIPCSVYAVQEYFKQKHTSLCSTIL